MQKFTYIGIDIGKSEIYYHYQTSTQEVIAGKFANNAEEIKQFVSSLPTEAHCVLEATGVYHFPLCFALQDAQKLFTILNPSTSSAYARSLNMISKTDKSDSAMLARFGRERNPDATQLESEEWYKFRQLINRWQHLLNRKQVIENQLHALRYYPQQHSLVIAQMEAEIKMITQQIEVLTDTIKQELPTDYESMLEIGTSIVGIGKKTATILLFFTQGLKSFENAKQLAKYIGIASTTSQSGYTRKQGHITKRGSSLLRSLLYNCAKSAKRFNPAAKEIYERLRSKGKPHKVAMVAVMNKLVKQFFAVIKSGVPYERDYHSKIRQQQA
jgi:transposase